MRHETCTVAIDLGTTTIKVASFADSDGRQVAAAKLRVGVEADEAGAATQDPEVVYEGVVDLLSRVSSESARSGCEIGAVGFSAAMHTLLAADSAGAPLTPVLTWLDTRAASHANALWATAEGREIYARTGTPVHAMSPLAKLLWLRAERGHLWQGGTRFVSLKEWIWHRWFDEWSVDRSIASATGLYSLAGRDWDQGALSLVGVDRRRLSTPVATTYSRRGMLDDRLRGNGLSAATPFVIGASDGVLANLGVGAVDASRTVLTIGTSLAVRLGAPQPMTDAAIRSFCYVLDEGRYVVGAASNSGGVLLDWLRTSVLGGGTSDEGPGLSMLLNEAAGVDTGELVCLPYVAGERAPLWDATATAALAGLRLAHTRAHIVRAAVEGILFNARWLIESLFRLAGPTADIVAAGRPFSQGWIRQLAADVFGLPVRDAGEVDASLRGAALLARMAVGRLGWADVQGSAPSAGPVCLPGDYERWSRRYERFRSLVEPLTRAAG